MRVEASPCKPHLCTNLTGTLPNTTPWYTQWWQRKMNQPVPTASNQWFLLNGPNKRVQVIRRERREHERFGRFFLSSFGRSNESLSSFFSSILTLNVKAEETKKCLLSPYICGQTKEERSIKALYLSVSPLRLQNAAQNCQITFLSLALSLSLSLWSLLSLLHPFLTGIQRGKEEGSLETNAKGILVISNCLDAHHRFAWKTQEK